MIVVVCSAIIRKGNTFLMVKEFKPGVAGKWGLPGGKLEEGESIRDAVRREVQEETGFAVTAERLFSIVNKPKTHEGNTVIRFIFQCELSDQPVSSGEHEYRLLSVAQLEDLAVQELVRGQEVIPLLKKAITESTSDPENFLQIV